MQSSCILGAPTLIPLRVYAECIYVFLSIKILSSSLNSMLIVDKHWCDIYCDEFSMSQINCKSKQVKEP